MIPNVTSPRARRYIYRVAMVTVPLLITLGVVADNIAPHIVAILAAVLVPELAASNVDVPKQDGV